MQSELSATATPHSHRDTTSTYYVLFLHTLKILIANLHSCSRTVTSRHVTLHCGYSSFWYQTSNLSVFFLSSLMFVTYSVKYVTPFSAKDCGQPPKILHGNLPLHLFNTTYGSKVTYSCDSLEYNMVGSAVIKCIEDGTWSTIPFCHSEFVKSSCLNKLFCQHFALHLFDHPLCFMFLFFLFPFSF